MLRKIVTTYNSAKEVLTYAPTDVIDFSNTSNATITTNNTFINNYSGCINAKSITVGMNDSSTNDNLSINADTIRLIYDYLCPKREIHYVPNNWKLKTKRLIISAQNSTCEPIIDAECDVLELNMSTAQFSTLNCKNIKLSNPRLEYLTYLKQFNIPKYSIHSLNWDYVFDDVKLNLERIANDSLVINNSKSAIIKASRVVGLTINDSQTINITVFNAKNATIHGQNVKLSNCELGASNITAHDLQLDNVTINDNLSLKVTGKLVINKCTFNDSIIEVIKNCGAKKVEWEIL